MTSKETAQTIKQCIENLQSVCPDYRITLVIREPDKEISWETVMIVSNDAPEKVLRAVQLQSTKQPDFRKKKK